jgi:hypothetical protein
MTKQIRKKSNALSKKEMSSTGSYKLLENENISLKKTLANTQNELETYRSKYNESDKKNGIYESMKRTIVLHEVIKFIATGMLGGLGINLFSDSKWLYGSVSIIMGIILYVYVVSVDNKIFNKENK